MELYFTATECHLPYGITQCYLPPDTGGSRTLNKGGQGERQRRKRGREWGRGAPFPENFWILHCKMAHFQAFWGKNGFFAIYRSGTNVDWPHVKTHKGRGHGRIAPRPLDPPLKIVQPWHVSCCDAASLGHWLRLAHTDCRRIFIPSPCVWAIWATTLDALMTCSYGSTNVNTVGLYPLLYNASIASELHYTKLVIGLQEIAWCGVPRYLFWGCRTPQLEFLGVSEHPRHPQWLRHWCVINFLFRPRTNG